MACVLLRLHPEAGEFKSIGGDSVCDVQRVHTLFYLGALQRELIRPTFFTALLAARAHESWASSNQASRRTTTVDPRRSRKGSEP